MLDVMELTPTSPPWQRIESLTEEVHRHILATV